MTFPFQQQLNEMDCGPTCLYMISKFHGRNLNIETIRNHTELGKEGVNLFGISNAAEKIGLRTLSVEISFEKLIKEAPLPCIVHWEQKHFIVVTPKSTLQKVVVADPANGIIKYSKEEFCLKWLNTTDEVEGIALLVEPTPNFYKLTEETSKTLSWGFLTKYLSQYKKYFLQLSIGLFISSLLQLLFPFLTQSIVDVGINTKNLQYIYLILFAQLFLFAGRTITEFIRSRLLLFIGTRINISILSDFWIKLLKLPVSYFDTKKTGDILQRIGDHSRIQQFLTVGSLNVIFSLFNLVIFSIVLLIYSVPVFIVFATGSILYFVWIRFFLKFRRKIDTQRFSLASKENTATMQLIQGMQEIRLNSCEKPKRWEWERLQAALFKLSFKSLSISQYQQAGAFFINEGKNLVITFFTAKAVLEGQLSLGGMLAIQYIIGQLNSPIEQLISFIQQAQDAKISLERLNEIHSLEDEEPIESNLQKTLPQEKTIQFKNLSFTYTGAGNEPVLKNINLEIPNGKTTAIVGMSGSGKTTLLKLLLKFYSNYTGDIKIGETNLQYISPEFWRTQCSSVMQDGYIFNDTIANNVAVTEDKPNHSKLIEACKSANILSFIESLPLGFNTKIGIEGTGVSQGQKQRILIARAIYKNPHFIFLDEATNALDANNEKEILENLSEFFIGKTAIVVAHRLSTVKNADKIIVLKNGEIVEEGSHSSLTNNKRHYYELVKNQLELGN
jgi:ATP-binding cassette, subfamily B, bacterial